MAASTILLGRSSACLLGSGSQFYSRYLSLNRSHIIIPTCISRARLLCSSSPSNSNTPTAENNIKQQAKNQPNVSEILAELESMKKELNTLRKERQGKKEQPIGEVAVVKDKHPLLKSIELEMSKSQELNLETEGLMQLPHGFQVESDIPGTASVTLKRRHQDEIINIELSIPAYYVMLLEVEVTLSGLFYGLFNCTEAVFHCTYTSNGFEVVKIKEHTATDHGILFYNLPKNLKDEFYKYLEIRGVHKNNVSILYKYMVSRTNKENLRSLEKLKNMHLFKV